MYNYLKPPRWLLQIVGSKYFKENCIFLPMTTNEHIYRKYAYYLDLTDMIIYGYVSKKWAEHENLNNPLIAAPLTPQVLKNLYAFHCGNNKDKDRVTKILQPYLLLVTL
jgi:hypothetical protein